MIITLEELTHAADRLPDPRYHGEMGKEYYKVAIVEKVPVAPVTAETPISVNVRFVTFRVKRFRKDGAIFWRWTPVDEVVI